MEGKAAVSRELYVSLTSSRGQSVARYFASFQPGSVSFSYSSAPPSASPTGSSDITEIQEGSTVGDIDLGVFYTPLNRDWVQGLRIFAMKMESSSSLSISFKLIFPGFGEVRGFQKQCGLLPRAEMCFRVTGWLVMMQGIIWWSSQDCTRAGAVAGREKCQARVFAHVIRSGTGELLLFIISLSMLRWKKKSYKLFSPNSAIFTQQCGMSSGVFLEQVKIRIILSQLSDWLLAKNIHRKT